MIEALTDGAGKTEARKQYFMGYRIQTFYYECILKLDYEPELSGMNP